MDLILSACPSYSLAFSWTDASESDGKMPPKQRMRIASQKHSQNVSVRGNVPKSQIVSIVISVSVRVCVFRDVQHVAGWASIGVSIVVLFL